jgi:hypothetical protein
LHKLGETRSSVLAMLETRLDKIFKLRERGTCWTGGEDPAVSDRPDSLQLTQMPPEMTLDNHFDSRTWWHPGIATVALSKEPGISCCHGSAIAADEGGDGDAATEPVWNPCGDDWTLNMQRKSRNVVEAAGEEGAGAAQPQKKQKQYRTEYEYFRRTFPAGTAYLISGSAQGNTDACLAKESMHHNCACCWSHGVQPVTGALSNRFSLTMRSYVWDWGTEPSARGKQEAKQQKKKKKKKK